VPNHRGGPGHPGRGRGIRRSGGRRPRGTSNSGTARRAPRVSARISADHSGPRSGGPENARGRSARAGGGYFRGRAAGDVPRRRPGDRAVPYGVPPAVAPVLPPKGGGPAYAQVGPPAGPGVGRPRGRGRRADTSPRLNRKIFVSDDGPGPCPALRYCLPAPGPVSSGEKGAAMHHIEHFSQGLLTPLLGYALSVVGSLLGLVFAARARSTRPAGRVRWLACAALALGGT